MTELDTRDLFGSTVADAAEPSASSLDIVFSTGDVHARDRLDYWQAEATKVFFDHTFDTTIGRSFRGTIRAASIGELAFSDFECDEATVEYPDSCVSRATSDDLVVVRLVEGETIFRQDGRTAEPKPGDFFLIDPRRPFAIDVLPGYHTVSVKFPRSELEARLGDVSALSAQIISGTHPVASLASGFLDMIIQSNSTLEEPIAAKVTQQALDLIALSMRSKFQNGGLALSSPRSATLLRLKAVIEEGLRDPALKPTRAAAVAGISVRYANALLADEGTSLERYIMDRRLENCHRELTAPAHASRTVSDIAYAWGFSDLSHFTRRFKMRFGCSPRQLRSQSPAHSDAIISGV